METITDNKSETLASPNIYSYHDYRLYLKDYLQYLKQTSNPLSMRELAQQMRISVTYLSLILSGSRKITKKVRKAFSRFINLSEAEKNYFDLLCDLTDSTNQEEKLQAIQAAQSFHNYKRKNPSEAETFRYLTKWYHVAIRELALLPDFSLDPLWIQQRLCFPVGRQDVLKAVEFLISKNFLTIDEEGKVLVTQKQIKCVDEIFKTAMIEYHRQTLELASQSMDIMTRDERLISGRALAIPQSKFSEAQKILLTALEQISKLAESSASSDTIYHMGVFAFPMAQLPKVSDDENL